MNYKNVSIFHAIAIEYPAQEAKIPTATTTIPRTTAAIENQSTPHVIGDSFGGRSNSKVSFNISK